MASSADYLLRLYNYFSKYEFIENSTIKDFFYNTYEEEYELTKIMICSIYGIELEENNSPIVDITEDDNNDEGNESESESEDSDSEYSIPEGAEIIESDNYDPELVILENVIIKKERIEENKKRSRPVEFELDEPAPKFPANCHPLCVDDCHFYVCHNYNPFYELQRLNNINKNN